MNRSLLAASLVFAGIAAWSSTAAPPDNKGGAPSYRMVGDYTSVYGFDPIRVEAIGLVVGLPKTGGDPPPGLYREQVLTLMRQNEVEAPEKLLATKTVAAVLLKRRVGAVAAAGRLRSR